MKGSARAGSVIAAPAKAEERLLKVCAGVADKNNWINRHVRHCLPAVQDDTCIAL